MSALFVTLGLILMAAALVALPPLLVVVLTEPKYRRLRMLPVLLAVVSVINIAGVLAFGFAEIAYFGKGPFTGAKDLVLRLAQYSLAGCLTGVFLRLTRTPAPMLLLAAIVLSWMPMFIAINTGHYETALQGLLANCLGGLLGIRLSAARKPA